MITKKNLLDIGFIERFSTPEESGEPNGFYYYVFEINGKCLLISDTSNINQYEIELFDFNDISFTNINELRKFVEIVKFNAVK